MIHVNLRLFDHFNQKATLGYSILKQLYLINCNLRWGWLVLILCVTWLMIDSLSWCVWLVKFLDVGYTISDRVCYRDQGHTFSLCVTGLVFVSMFLCVFSLNVSLFHQRTGIMAWICQICTRLCYMTCVWVVYFLCLLVYDWCIFNVYCVWLVYFHCLTENRDRALGLSEMYQAISQLPQANKDTLAFLILHLLR